MSSIENHNGHPRKTRIPFESRARQALRWFGLGLAFFLTILHPSWSLAHENPAPLANRPPLIVVRGIGTVPPAHLRAACRSLLDTLPVRCAIRESRDSHSFLGAWSESRQQLDARGALEQLFRSRDVDGVVELAITAHDIYEGRRPFVFGLASLTDRVAVVSTARIAGDPERFEERLAKLVRHEVAHTMGMAHHAIEGCVMRSDPDLASLDRAPSLPCSRCRRKLYAKSRTLARPGQIELDYVRGLLIRGERELAREEANRSLFHSHEGVVVELGSLFLRAGMVEDAIAILEFAHARQPERPEVHLQLGLALQLRGREDDLPAAIHHLERALRMRPQWRSVAIHLSKIRRNLARAQGPAPAP